ncbi:hypothetical protein L9F63_017156, partial [Diploptera punctata]
DGNEDGNKRSMSGRCPFRNFTSRKKTYASNSHSAESDWRNCVDGEIKMNFSRGAVQRTELYTIC